MVLILVLVLVLSVVADLASFGAAKLRFAAPIPVIDRFMLVSARSMRFTASPYARRP
jgi:hypothetical protein